MAICPECLDPKPFFARRCSSCNEEIGFMRQTVAMYIYFSTTIFGFWFAAESILTLSFAGYVLWIWFLFVAIPAFILWLILFLYFLIFD
jgi:uncharacterized protein (DUF983 family)